jgi:predicted Zn-dependent protease
VIAKPGLADFANLASSGIGLLFLKFGRDDETQADRLGFRYMTTAGYDPHEMAEMFRTLDRLGGGGEGRVPEWLSTHPNPGNRVQDTRTRITQAANLPANPRVGRDEFIRKLDGLVFGEDPRQGFFRGSTFLHPDMKFQLEFPSGWKSQNQASQVVSVSGQQDAIVALTLAGNTSPSQAMSQFMGQQGMQNRGTSNASINGYTASSGAFVATTNDGTVAGWVAFISIADGVTLRMLGYTLGDRINTYDNTLRASVTSVRRLTDQSALSVQPARVRVVRLDRAMTIDEFNRSQPSTIPVAQLALINGVEANATIPAGTLVKRVTK